MTRPDSGSNPAAAITRVELHRVATHVLARARHAATGRFGLRAGADGIATPAFGPGAEVVRIAGSVLLRERGVDGRADTSAIAIAGSSLRDLARFAGVDLDVSLSVGHDTPELGDVDRPIALDHDEVERIWAWFALGARALGRVVAHATTPSIVQLWPEHFDLAVDVDASSTRVNLGVSPGDDHVPGRYAYVGPWSAARPGDPAFWNAPFGAVLAADSLTSSDDHAERVEALFATGLAALTGA